MGTSVAKSTLDQSLARIKRKISERHPIKSVPRDNHLAVCSKPIVSSLPLDAHFHAPQRRKGAKQHALIRNRTIVSKHVECCRLSVIVSFHRLFGRSNALGCTAQERMGKGRRSISSTQNAYLWPRNGTETRTYQQNSVRAPLVGSPNDSKRYIVPHPCQFLFYSVLGNF